MGQARRNRRLGVVVTLLVGGFIVTTSIALMFVLTHAVSALIIFTCFFIGWWIAISKMMDVFKKSGSKS